MYTLIGTAPPKPTVEKEIEERIINKKIPKAEDLGQYQIQENPHFDRESSMFGNMHADALLTTCPL